MTERLVIDRIGHRGDGVVVTAAGPLYVPFTLPGERVEVDGAPGNPDHRHLLAVMEPSAERIEPICPHFGICGGCALQHWSAAPYRAWKRDLVVTALAQAGIDAPVDNLIDAHGDGRRRAVFHARLGTHDVLDVGFSAARAHRIIPIDRCPILAPGLDGAIEAAWAIAEALMPVRKPLDIQVTATDAGLDIDVRGSGQLTAASTATLARVAAAQRLARLTRHGELVAQRATPTLRMGAATMSLPPGCIPAGHRRRRGTLAKLRRGALRAARSRSPTCSAASGRSRCGSPSRRASMRPTRRGGHRRAQARCRDDAGAQADRNAARAICSAGRTLPSELERFDAVVFDPPRQGAEAQARELAASKVPDRRCGVMQSGDVRARCAAS